MQATSPAALDDESAALGTADLLGGIVGDVRDLVGAHADELREALSHDVRELRDTLLGYLAAAAVAIVGAIAVIAALADTLVVVGVPWIAALWIMAFVMIVIAIVFIDRARGGRVGLHTAKALTP